MATASVGIAKRRSVDDQDSGEGSERERWWRQGGEDNGLAGGRFVWHEADSVRGRGVMSDL